MAWYKRLNWVNAIFLIVTPVIVSIFIPLNIIFHGFDWRLVLIFILGCLATSVSITGGYHRLFAHRSYEANWLLKLFYLVFGAAALQGSAIKWCSDHRRHHKHVDTDVDPYSISKGFLFAHVGWVFLKDDPQYREFRSQDLKADPLVVWQNKYYFLLAVIVGFGIPTLIGLAFGSPWGGLLWGGFARVVITHHCTFFINSLCHMWGKQPYGKKNSARDNFVLAFFTYGEGYHNFHHRFEADYRNGVRWYQWDPTKWWIRSLSFFKLTRNLKRVPDSEILKARLQADESLFIAAGSYNERLREIKTNIEERLRQMAQFRKEKLKFEFKSARIELRALLAQWRLARRLYGKRRVEFAA